MARYLTTSQLADALGLSDSTVRHYRSEGRIVPTRQTPGGHARYDLEEVETALGIEAITDDAPITGLVSESFAPLGVHDLRPVPAGGSLAAEVVALGVRDARVPGQYAFPGELEENVLRPLRDTVIKAMGKNSRGGHLASSLLGVWSSTDRSPAVSLIFLVDPNRLASLAPGLDAAEAVEELVGPVRKSLGKSGTTVQIEATARSLTGVSAYELMMAHRQIDLDLLPTGGFAAEDEIARATAGSSDC